MSDRLPLDAENLLYVVPASDTNFSYSETWAMTSRLSMERLQTMESRIQQSLDRKEEDRQWLKGVWFDWGPVEYFKEPEDYWEFEEEDHPKHVFWSQHDGAQRTGYGYFAARDAMPQAEPLRSDLEQMEAYDDSIRWVGELKNTEVRFHTHSMPRGHVYLGRFLLGEAADRELALSRLAAHAPRMFLNAIENGVAVVGAEHVSVRADVQPKHLASLLEHDDADIRQRAILALGALGMKPEDVRPGRGRSR